MSRADLKALSGLSAALQEQLPGDFRVFKAVAQQQPSTGANLEPEDGIEFELMIVSDRHNVVLQGRANWLIRMAQKYEFGEFNHAEA